MKLTPREVGVLFAGRMSVHSCVRGNTLCVRWIGAAGFTNVSLRIGGLTTGVRKQSRQMG